METRLEAMEQQVFKCQGMVERGLNANHMMITEFTSNHKMDAIDIGKHLSRLYDRVDQLQGQIYDLQNQNSCGCSHDRKRKMNTKQGFPHCVWESYLKTSSMFCLQLEPRRNNNIKLMSKA
ncbi:40S ribosomal protein S5-1 [Hordeum vulgare]|nr:40S ribosomal protein S5-1 [Hordeum vulgare]